MTRVRVLAPTGHLGFTPMEEGSFHIALEHRPDYIVADSGSCDIGPAPLGGDTAASPEAWQRRDLEVLLQGARRLGVPLIIGSCSDTGTDRGVTQYLRLIRELAAEQSHAPFRLATIYSEIQLSDLKEMVRDGKRIIGLEGRADANGDLLERTHHAVAVMDAEPIRSALRAGAEVILCGRSSDCALFAAPLIEAGIDPGTAYYAGKLLECASLCATPFMAKESVMGEVEGDAIDMTPMHPRQRCTPASVASHAMYERISPDFESVASGRIDMRACTYEQISERTTRARGARFIPADMPRVKLEGAGKVGERRVFIVGISDPWTIAHIDEAVAWARQCLEDRFGPEGERYRIFYHLYGRNGVMGELDPAPAVAPHELGIVVEAISADSDLAEQVCSLGARNLLFARLDGMKGTAGAVAFMDDTVLTGKAAYEWTLNHVFEVADACEPFRTEFHTING